MIWYLKGILDLGIVRNYLFADYSNDIGDLAVELVALKSS